MKRKYNNPMRERLRERHPRTFMDRVCEYLWGDDYVKFSASHKCTTGHDGIE